MFETDADSQEDDELMVEISTTFILITHELPVLVPIYLDVNFLDFFTEILCHDTDCSYGHVIKR